jgi:5-amino-6-(5-phosphoribosylamino)uracil reductase
MPDRPYVLLSCAMSADGYIDDATGQRLVLSNDADYDRVDAERAGCHAILVGANTIRRDNPRLLVRSSDRRAAREAQGLPPNPIRVTLTSSGVLDATASFFTAGDTPQLVYCTTSALDVTAKRLRGIPTATVVDAGDPLDLHTVLADLAARGVQRLMVEGGCSVHTQFLTAGLADELQLVVAPFFVGDARAPRFVGDGSFPWDPRQRMPLAEVRQIDDVVLLRYLLSDGPSRSQPRPQPRRQPRRVST